MKNIVFIAPPAAGKGTQSGMLVDKYGYVHVSSGDLLREEMSNQTELGRQIEADMNKGNLIADEIVFSLIKKKLSIIDKPFILDGIPRKVEQIPLLDETLNSINKKIDLVLYFNITEAEASRRACGRRTCPACKRIYHKYDECIKPKVDGICDKCGLELLARGDDNEESFKVRYQTYMENTMPLIEYYRSNGLLKEIAVGGTAEATPEETFAEIEKVI